MSGLCLVAGAADAATRIRGPLARLGADGTPSTHVGAQIAIGVVNRNRLGVGATLETFADGLVVALDGEILDDGLDGQSPSAHVAELYAAQELDKLAWLNGSFAVAIYDPARATVVAASDRFGSRSLFIWHDGVRLSIASRLAVLLADDRVPRRLSGQGITELLRFQRTVGDHTQYADIRALPAAAVWLFADGRVTRRQSRRLAWRRPDFDQREGAQLLAAAMRRATARAATAAMPGLLLSGGLDARWVMVCARAEGRTLSCLTTATHDNDEVAIARASAARARMSFRFVRTPPDSLPTVFDAATVASDGLFQAPINLYGLLPAAAAEHDVLLSGHGLDYTFRGYYLPCKSIRLGRSTTRLPMLQPVPDGRPATVLASLRVSPAAAVAGRLLRGAMAEAWDDRAESAMATALAYADIEDPYNAWDAFILHCLGRHYAYSDFVAMQSVVGHRAVCFDHAVFDLYLAMPPAWRASGRMAHAAMMAVGADLMGLPDANSGVAARHPFGTQLALAYGRAALRRLGLLRTGPLGAAAETRGSWADYGVLLRANADIRARAENLATNAALLDSGMFDAAGVRSVVADHMAGRANHKRVLFQLMTLASWLGTHGYDRADLAA